MHAPDLTQLTQLLPVHLQFIDAVHWLDEHAPQFDDEHIARLHDAVVPPPIPKQFHLYSVDVSAASWNVPAAQLFNVVPHWPLTGSETLIELPAVFWLFALSTAVAP